MIGMRGSTGGLTKRDSSEGAVQGEVAGAAAYLVDAAALGYVVPPTDHTSGWCSKELPWRE